jgi:hypothetical protein
MRFGVFRQRLGWNIRRRRRRDIGRGSINDIGHSGRPGDVGFSRLFDHAGRRCNVEAVLLFS